MNRWKFLGLLLAGSSLVACGGDSTPTPTPTPDSGTPMDVPVADTPTPPPPDVPRDVRPTGDTPDASATMCGRLPFINLNTTGMRTDRTTRVTATNAEAWMQQTNGMVNTNSPLRPPTNSTCTPMRGQLVYRYTTGAQPAALRITTTNPGTPARFDTVLWVLSSCAASSSGVLSRIDHCNDDDDEHRVERFLSSLVTTRVYPANTNVYVVVGGFYPPPAGGGSDDRGPFELSVTELSPVAMGGACPVDQRTAVCEEELFCVGLTPNATMGTCQPRGVAPGSPCRPAAPECDMGLECTRTATASGGQIAVCTRAAERGQPCDTRINPAYRICGAGLTCVNTTLGNTVGTCVNTGSTPGFACRPMGAMGGRCDTGMVCDADTDMTAGAGTCRTPVGAGMPCNLLTSLCMGDATCVATTPDSNVGRCQANGSVAGTRCRAAMPRCGAMLECRTFGSGATARDFCVTPVATGGRCVVSQFQLCADTQGCYFTDLSDRTVGRCGAPGQSGGACLQNDAMPCEGMGLSCSVTSPATTANGVCQNVSMAGMPCERPLSRCGDGLTCVLNDGSDTRGTCRAEGSVAGAECRAGDMPCMTGLTCSGTAYNGGVCQTDRAPGMPCDPLYGTTRCTMNSVCRPTTYRAGSCGMPTGMETEPNNTPMTAGMPAAAQVTLSAALPSGDVDCVAVTVAANGGVLAQASDGNGGCPPRGAGGIVLDLYAPDGTSVISSVDLSGPGNCATIDGNRRGVYDFASGLAAGTYYVCARGYVNANGQGTPDVSRYYLTVGPLPPRM